MSSRDKILNALKANRPPFPEAAPRPDDYLPVTAVDPSDLLGRFKAELEKLTGKVYLCDSEADGTAVIKQIIGTDKQVIAWGALSLAGLQEALLTDGIEIVTPLIKGEDRRAALQTIEPIRVGITGADAGLATTGSLVMITNDDQGRLPSLMPPVHIAILRKERLYANLEAWIAAQGRDALAASNSITVITGPSRTGDIEMMIVLGVHGPGAVHVVIV
ncbi:MAG: lactate utilization protein [Anaerolineae bacterium]|nr:lactate utilization protein [Anaerolineae bacterium]